MKDSHSYELHHGDALNILRGMPDNSIDSVVTDPPYGLSFLGCKWDYDVPSVELWAECLRVLKPGGHLLAFAGTRTQHRMAVRIEDAGFEIRDMIAWVYGSGFPKSLDVSKAIDKAAGAEREVIGTSSTMNQKTTPSPNAMGARPLHPEYGDQIPITAPATDAAKQWDGWGTALKPSFEPVTLARKPLAERTVAANVLEWGTGGVNIDECRVGVNGGTAKGSKPQGKGNGIYGAGLHGACEITRLSAGRFPANLIHDGSDEVVRLFPVTSSGFMRGGEKASKGAGMFGGGQSNADTYGDTGSAARFFYCAKASRSERETGLEGGKCTHPTVKPIALMRYLCRLVTPPGGIVLDPFNGSGTTGCAAMLEGFRFIGIERETEYIEIARRRIEYAISHNQVQHPTLFDERER